MLETIKPDHTAVVFSDYEMTTADFTRHPNLKIPGAALRHAIEERAKQLFGEFIAKAGSAPEYADAVKRSKERMEEIEQIIEFNKQTEAERKAAEAEAKTRAAEAEAMGTDEGGAKPGGGGQ